MAAWSELGELLINSAARVFNGKIAKSAPRLKKLLEIVVGAARHSMDPAEVTGHGQAEIKDVTDVSSVTHAAIPSPLVVGAGGSNIDRADVMDVYNAHRPIATRNLSEEELEELEKLKKLKKLNPRVSEGSQSQLNDLRDADDQRGLAQMEIEGARTRHYATLRHGEAPAPDVKSGQDWLANELAKAKEQVEAEARARSRTQPQPGRGFGFSR